MTLTSVKGDVRCCVTKALRQGTEVTSAMKIRAISNFQYLHNALLDLMESHIHRNIIFIRDRIVRVHNDSVYAW